MVSVTLKQQCIDADTMAIIAFTLNIIRDNAYNFRLQVRRIFTRHKIRICAQLWHIFLVRLEFTVPYSICAAVMVRAAQIVMKNNLHITHEVSLPYRKVFPKKVPLVTDTN
jgi:hypothetical protein